MIETGESMDVSTRRCVSEGHFVRAGDLGMVRTPASWATDRDDGSTLIETSGFAVDHAGRIWLDMVLADRADAERYGRWVRACLPAGELRIVQVTDQRVIRPVGDVAPLERPPLSLGGRRAPYGFCPQCRTPGVARERGVFGNDRCEAGHTYPSASAVKR